MSKHLFAIPADSALSLQGGGNELLFTVLHSGQGFPVSMLKAETFTGNITGNITFDGKYNMGYNPDTNSLDITYIG